MYYTNMETFQKCFSVAATCSKAVIRAIYFTGKAKCMNKKVAWRNAGYGEV